MFVEYALEQAGVGSGNKVKKIVLCLFEVLKLRKHRLFEKVLFTVLSRDARATKLVVRFNAIDSDFKTMRGVVGVQPSLSGSMDILESTKTIIKRFATKNCMGKKGTKFIPGLHKDFTHSVRLTSVDIASNELPMLLTHLRSSLTSGKQFQKLRQEKMNGRLVSLNLSSKASRS